MHGHMSTLSRRREYGLSSQHMHKAMGIAPRHQPKSFDKHSTCQLAACRLARLPVAGRQRYFADEVTFDE